MTSSSSHVFDANIREVEVGPQANPQQHRLRVKKLIVWDIPRLCAHTVAPDFLAVHSCFTFPIPQYHKGTVLDLDLENLEPFELSEVMFSTLCVLSSLCTSWYTITPKSGQFAIAMQITYMDVTLQSKCHSSRPVSA